MSNTWINWRFGTRHLIIGPWFVKVEVNKYYTRTPPEKWFQNYG